MGWNCTNARNFGFSLQEMLDAGCSINTIRIGGWDGISDAAQLRMLGIDACRMKASSWRLSELKAAGYSAACLRQAGFSRQAVEAVSRLLMRDEGKHRKPTWQIQKEFEDNMLPTSKDLK